MEAAFGRLHNMGAARPPTVLDSMNDGWGYKWLDDTFLKHFVIVSKTFHQFYPAIYRCLDVRSFVMCL